MSQAIVIEASAVVELLVASAVERHLGRRLTDPEVDIHAPHLLTVEVTQALRRAVARGGMSPARGRAALEDLVDLAVQRHDHEPLLPRVWQLRDNVTAYDALYLALSEALDAPLLTLDAGLGRAPGHRAVVEVLGSAG